MNHKPRSVAASRKTMPPHHDPAPRRGIVYGLALLATLLAAPAAAVVLPDEVQQKLARDYDAFVQAAGFKPIDPSVVSDGFYSRQRFPDPDTTSVVSVDADLDAATKALMLLDSREPALPRVRYRITYRSNDTPYAPGYTTTYIEVTRSNVGPRLHAETVASTPKGVPTAPPETFGAGPSVSWRFVMRRRQGALMILRAARRLLTETQAQAMDCLGVSCLATTDPTGPAGDWEKIRPPPMKSAPYVTVAHGRSTAPRIAALLYRTASHGEPNIEPLHVNGDTPQLTFVISMGIAGNECIAHGLLHQGLLRDDAVSGIWTHRPDWGADPVEWRELIEHWPGRN